MTPEEIIEHARLVRVFLESDEFKAAWESVEGALLREFREASEPEQALAVHEQMKAMQRLMFRWRSTQTDAAIARKEREYRDRPRSSLSRLIRGI